MKLRKLLSSAHSLAAWIERNTLELPVPATPRIRLVAPCLAVTHEHHQAILLLLSRQHPLHASAFALVRPTFESLVRGLWLLNCANDDDIAAFGSTGAVPRMPRLLKDLEAVPEIDSDFLTKIYTQSWEAMCAYTHTGELQVQRWNSPHTIEPTYSEAAVREVVLFTGVFAILAAIWMSVISDNQPLGQRALAKLKAWVE